MAVGGGGWGCPDGCSLDRPQSPSQLQKCGPVTSHKPLLSLNLILLSGHWVTEPFILWRENHSRQGQLRALWGQVRLTTNQENLVLAHSRYTTTLLSPLTHTPELTPGREQMEWRASKPLETRSHEKSQHVRSLPRAHCSAAQ